MLGAFVFELEAIKDGSIPISHGRLLHAALLKLINGSSEELSAYMHSDTEKCFSIGLLRTLKKPVRGSFDYSKGDKARWRICSLDDRLTNIILSIPLKTIMKIGRVDFMVNNVVHAPEEDSEAGITDINYLVKGCSAIPLPHSVTINFLTPTTFRAYDKDYPFPNPDLVFTSLAKRFNAFSNVVSFDVKLIKEMIKYIIPDKWEGKSVRYNITAERGINCFVGCFSYDLSLLPPEYRRIIVLLCEFAVFSGVGRLTAQGLGTVKISYQKENSRNG